MGQYKNQAKLAAKIERYNERRRLAYRDRKRSVLPDILPSGRYPFYWEECDHSPIANPALDCYTTTTSSPP